tara:strand:- start:71 stop:493 length:423 start_codon:yes stop_codon:yes gene_type:complete
MVLDYNKAIADGLTLFTGSHSHQRYNLFDITTYLVLPIKNNRVRLFYEQESRPVGLVTWCWLTEYRAQKLLQYEYNPVQEDYEDTDIENKQLWGLDFISTTGKAKQMMTSVRQEHAKLYGKAKVYWRRFSDPTKAHKKEF